jgi:dsRNA-specific ribonuclease
MNTILIWVRFVGIFLCLQGTGRSKKEAKIAGARRAFAALLDLDEEAFDTKFAGKNTSL